MKLPLNVKSCYSFMNSTIKIDSYIKYGVKNNLKYLAINDNNLFGAFEFYNECMENNIKPIIGLNLFLEIDNKILNLNFFAKNYSGYLELIKLNSKKKYNNLNDILKSKIQNCLLVVDKSDFNFILNLKIVSKTDIWIGTNNNIVDPEQTNNTVNFNLVNILHTRDNSAVNLLIAQDQDINYENQNSKTNFSFDDFDNLTDNVSTFASLINLEIKKFKFNELEIKFPNPLVTIKKLCSDKLKLLKLNNPKYEERLAYELNVVHKMNFENYFLIISDYINYAKKQNIFFSPGRGSAAGSLVSYLLGITKIDPIKYDLLFERFLNPQRISLPDIDLDFEDTKRDEIFKYLIEKYGKNNFAQITTFQTFGIKGAIKLFFERIIKDNILFNKFNKIISKNKIDTLVDLKKLLNQQEKINFLSFDFNNFISIIEKIVGLPINTSTHAAGIILSDQNISEIIPVDYENVFPKSKYKMQCLEIIGFIKFDLLGLHTLKVIHNIIDSIKDLYKIDLDLDAIYLNDQNVFNSLNSKHTLGIFQLESIGMTNALSEIKINSIEDIAAVSALYRPGPMKYISTYAKRKNKLEQYNYEHPDLKPILSSTYGILIYQEQIIQLVQIIAGFSLGEADIIRRAIGKKNESEMNSIKNKFITNSINKNYSEKIVNQIWDLIARFADYGFNKAHAISYAYISYQLAYLKVNYSASFYTEMLNDSVGNNTKLQHFINEAKEFDIEFIAPQINNLKMIFSPVNKNTIVIPIKSLKLKNNINWNDFIKLNVSTSDNLYEKISLLIKLNLERQDLITLIQANVFEKYAVAINKLLFNINKIWVYAKSITDYKGKEFLSEPLLSDNKDVIEIDEKNLFGFYFKENKFNKLIEKYNLTNKFKNIIDIKVDEQTNIVGVIHKVKVFSDKNNKKMCFFNIEDNTGDIAITVFSEKFQKLENKIIDNNFIILNVTVEKYNGKLKAILNNLKLLK